MTKTVYGEKLWRNTLHQSFFSAQTVDLAYAFMTVTSGWASTCLGKVKWMQADLSFMQVNKVGDTLIF